MKFIVFMFAWSFFLISAKAEAVGCFRQAEGVCAQSPLYSSCNAGWKLLSSCPQGGRVIAYCSCSGSYNFIYDWYPDQANLLPIIQGHCVSEPGCTFVYTR
jgi:hypothetical protein